MFTGFGEFANGFINMVASCSLTSIGITLICVRHKLYKQDFLDDIKQTIENRSCGTQIIGVQGSGKTYLAMMLFIDDIKAGFGSLWLSTQGIENSDLLNYIPEDKIKKVILLRPHCKNPQGINLFKRYTRTSLERTLIADSVVTLFKRLFTDVKINMESILSASTLALLEYSDITRKEVCLWDLYIFLTDESFRGRIINKINNPVIKDMIRELDGSKNNQSSLDAILRRFRTMLYNDNMLAFLSRKHDDLDLLRAVKQRKIIICDFLAGGAGSSGIGKENSRFLAELIVSKFQLVAETRNVNSSLYPLRFDEFQTYTTTSQNIKDFIDLNRQRRMPVTLIHQRRDQLSKELKDAVDSCGTKYILKINKNDWKHYQEMYPQYKDKINNDMKRREGIFDILSGSRNVDKWVNKTPDIYEKCGFGSLIEQNNKSKYTVREMVDMIMKESLIDEEIDSGDFQ